MVKFFNPNEGLHGRQGGPFLDDVQRKQTEETRAIREGREPDYDNMQPYVGDDLRTEEQLLQQAIHSATPPELTQFEGITANPLLEMADEDMASNPENPDVKEQEEQKEDEDTNPENTPDENPGPAYTPENDPENTPDTDNPDVPQTPEAPKF